MAIKGYAFTPYQQQVDVADNGTVTVKIGNKNKIRSASINYTIEAAGVNAYETGTITLIHDGTNTNIDAGRMNLVNGNPTESDFGISFSGNISGSNLNLLVTAASVGADSKFRYSVSIMNVMD